MARSRSKRPKTPKAAAPKAAESALAEIMFSDPRAQRDRRDRRKQRRDTNKELRRNPGDRRRSLSAKLQWWLQRNYVDSHHFIIKPPGRHHGGPGRKEED